MNNLLVTHPLGRAKARESSAGPVILGEESRMHLDCGIWQRGTRLGNPRWQESLAPVHKRRDLIAMAPQRIERMCRHRTEGMTLRAIARQLNKFELRTPRGALWYTGTVRMCFVG
jgi:Recombinase